MKMKTAVAFMPAEPGVNAYLVEEYDDLDSGKKRLTTIRDGVRYKLCAWALFAQEDEDHNRCQYVAWPVLNCPNVWPACDGVGIYGVVLHSENIGAELYSYSSNGLESVFGRLAELDKHLADMTDRQPWEPM